ncbi:Tetraspanin [Fasciola gigantica]|uniref:Tetraspanin n=1 Tax=Fasciola gigantica TaxID=46835 RepID=A0A504YGP6_FASGI|nr:Tetraspanin [Fasciola gigantica]
MVSLSCGYKCLQAILVMMNIVVAICGIALIVVGSVAEVNFKRYGTQDDVYLRAFIIFIIAFGCFITLVGIFGFCGACKKSVVCLTLYIIFLLILILAGLAAGIAGFVLKNKVKEYVTKSMTEAFDKYKDPPYQKIIDTIQKDVGFLQSTNLLQFQLKCCGANGTWTGPGSTPTSCQGSDGRFYTDGCVKNAQEFLKKNILIVAGCVFGFALIQILGIVFAACVCQAIKRGETA